MITAGLLLLDTNALRHFESPEQRRTLMVNARAAAWEVRMTAVNALEVAQTGNPHVRERLRSTLCALAQGTEILAWPHTFLNRSARAVAAAADRILVGEQQWERLCHGPISADLSGRAETFLSEQVDRFESLHSDARSEIQRFLKKHDLRFEWGSVQEFLNGMWMRPQHIDTYIEKLWTHFGMEGEAPVRILLNTRWWRMFWEIQGAAAYERAVAHEMPKTVHLLDWLQLLYFPLSERALLLTDDSSFRRAARQVLRGWPGRYWVEEAATYL